MIYTVFTLADPAQQEKVRFVGLTTQTVTKRLCDIVSVAKKPRSQGHNSMLSEWIRTLLEDGKQPWLEIILDTYDKDEALSCRVSTFNSHFEEGHLLNSTHGKLVGRRFRQPVTNTGVAPGRPVDTQTKSARYSLNRKQADRGEAELILRPYL